MERRCGCKRSCEIRVVYPDEMLAGGFLVKGRECGSNRDQDQVLHIQKMDLFTGQQPESRQTSSMVL